MKGLPIFFPILIFALFILYPDNFVVFSHSILGKIIAIAIIVYYVSLNILCGIFVCLLVILFYQYEIFETMLDYSSLNTEEDGQTIVNQQSSSSFEDSNEFKEEYCKHGKLMFKKNVVKPEMAQHIFPDIHFDNNTCNVCDSSCSYKIYSEPEKKLSYSQIF